MYKVAIISCGMIANSAHIPAYKAFPDKYEIVAVCDINEEAARKTAKEQAIPNYYTDAETMLKIHKPDVVSVCVPNVLHKQYTMLALSYGANVLCEKPLAYKYRDAKEMFDLAARNGRLLMTCQSLRFLPERLAAMEKIKQGEVGDIYYAEVSRIRRRGIPTWGKFHLKEFSGGGALLDIGVHGLDSVIWLMGNKKCRSVKADMLKVHADELGSAIASGALKNNVSASAFRPDEMDVESFASGHVSFADGATLSFTVAWAANLREENNIILVGKKSGIDIENRKIYSGAQDVSDLTVTPNGFQKEPFYGHFCLVENLCDVLDGKAELFVTPEETLNVTAIIEAAYLSNELGREVNMDEIVGEEKQSV